MSPLLRFQFSFAVDGYIWLLTVFRLHAMLWLMRQGMICNSNICNSNILEDRRFLRIEILTNDSFCGLDKYWK